MLEILQNYFSQAPNFGWNAFWISQGLIGIALITDIISWQCKKRETVLFWLVVSSFLIAFHLYLLGEVLGTTLVFLSGLRFLTSIFYTHRSLPIVFMTLVGILGIITYKNPADLVMLTGSLISCYGTFRNNDRELRLWIMLATSLIILYNILIFSPAAIMLDSIFLISNIIGYYRYYIKSKIT